MGIELMQFPDEILLAIISQVEEPADLCSLTLTCRRIQDLTEPAIYRSMIICQGEKAQHVAHALNADPRRQKMVEDVLVSCPFESWLGIEDLQDHLSHMPRLKSLRLETPDCNQRDHSERVHWRRIQERYEASFRRASVMLPEHLRGLDALRSCTIHFVDGTKSLYNLEEYSALLVHPTLEQLSLSCACVSREICETLRGYERYTSLKSLTLEQCDFDLAALTAILSLPKDLSTIHLSENFHDPPLVGWLTPSMFTKALRPQSHTLSKLTLLLAHPLRSDWHDTLETYDFSSFQQLTYFEFGQIPFYPFTHELQTQGAFGQRSRINLDQVVFPPNLKHFKYTNILTYSFPDNIEILKNTFYRSPSALDQPSIQQSPQRTSKSGGGLEELDVVLPVDSHRRIPQKILHRLARPAPHFYDIGVRYRVYDTQKQRGFIPPYLYQERSPENSLIIDNIRIRPAAPQDSGSQPVRAANRTVHTSAEDHPAFNGRLTITQLYDTDSEEDMVDPEYHRSRESIFPAASSSAHKVSILGPRELFGIALIADNADGVEWQDILDDQIEGFDPDPDIMANAFNGNLQNQLITFENLGENIAAQTSDPEDDGDSDYVDVPEEAQDDSDNSDIAV